MNKIIFSSLMIFALIAVPVANAQFGAPAYQKSTHLIIDELNNIEAKHVIDFSNDPVMVNLFEGAIIESITVTNEDGKELEFAISGMSDYGAVTIFTADENTIIKYNLKNMFRQSDNLLTLNVGYPKTFGILFSEKIDQIFLNNQLIQLGDKKGISINGGGYVNVEYYSEMPKIIEEVQWKEDKFDVEIITDSKIDKFNFDQESKSISFQVNEKNKFVTIIMSEELLGGPYVVLLDDEKISFNKGIKDENYILLNIKPQSTGEITIIGTTVIPEFSMFLPLIMGFLIILTVPFMKKFSLH
jgi:predicted DNA binding CopG/RHH family protein